MLFRSAVISPVGLIHSNDNDIEFSSGMSEMGPVIKKIRETLVGIQLGELSAPKGWIYSIA